MKNKGTMCTCIFTLHHVYYYHRLLARRPSKSKIANNNATITTIYTITPSLWYNDNAKTLAQLAQMAQRSETSHGTTCADEMHRLPQRRANRERERSPGASSADSSLAYHYR